MYSLPNYLVYSFLVFSALLQSTNVCISVNENGYVSGGTVLIVNDVDIYIVRQILLSSIAYFSQTLFF